MKTSPSLIDSVRAAVALALSAACSVGAHAADTEDDLLQEVVVTAARMRAPLKVVTDPHRPRQPLPAHDGADYLKTIPGFSSIRKGGTSGDPLFRGMAASRVKMLIDGEELLGGCGARMDPPTAYIFPEAFDRIVVVKGPQSVLDGPGNSAATVRFESQPPTFETHRWQVQGSALAASAGRSDLVGDVAFGNPSLHARINATRATADDYADGHGNDVHAAYERWSTRATLGWRPTAATLFEMDLSSSDGEAAYADRLMDGAKFARRGVSLRGTHAFNGGALRELGVQAYHNDIDHVMDNYSLRHFMPSTMMPAPSASNPDRRTSGARFALELAGPAGLLATVGLDHQQNRHRSRLTMDQTTMPYEAMDRTPDARFRNTGLFGEASLPVRDATRLVAGLRVDRWRAEDQRATVSVGMMGTMPNPTAGLVREKTLLGGFGRIEHALSTAGTTLYAGIGHVERFPDYWELVGTGRESTTSTSAFQTRPERTTQLDAGVVHDTGPLALSLSAFANRIDDYILIQSDFMKGMRMASVSRSVYASTLGAEADAAWQMNEHLQLTGTLAWTRGHNRTDGGALAQMPPLEARVGAELSHGRWHGGLLVRHAARQDRVAIGAGNVVGQDIGPSASFTVVSLNAAVQLSRGMLLSAGIDNLLDRNHAEHLSRGGAMLAGYTQSTRVNEPGRTLWMKLGVDLR